MKENKAGPNKTAKEESSSFNKQIPKGTFPIWAENSFLTSIQFHSSFFPQGKNLVLINN